MTESAALTGGPGDGSLTGSPTEGGAALALDDVGVVFPDMPLPDMLRAPDGRTPQHCGTPMEWCSPEPATVASHSYDPASHSAALPALWRCRCGFQLDGADQGAAGLVAAS